MPLSTVGWSDYSRVSSAWFEQLTTDPGPQAAFVSEETPQKSSVAATPQIGSDANRWIVRLSAAAVRQAGTVAEAAGLLTKTGVELTVIRGLGLPGQILVAAAGHAAAEVAAALRANPYVSSFEADRPIYGQFIPDDPELPQQWGLHNTGQTGGTADADIDAPEAWGITTGSSNVVVAVLDSGIDYTHPDLAANIWTNPGEIPGNGQDDDGNGFIDDVHGYDFYNGDGDPLDDHRHGTHVAGTIAAAGNNAKGVAGVSWSTQLMALKILGAENQGGTTGDALLALNYVTLMRARGVNVRVANNSWGYLGSSSPQLRGAIEACGEAGILFVAAAGNGDALGRGINNDADANDAFYPASEEADSIISVAASDPNDQLTRFSNYGVTSVDIAAPGAGIVSTEPGNIYRSRYGTSMAAPQVSGVAALVWASVPDATVSEVREAIRFGADPVTAFQGKLAWGGRLNAYGALMVDTASPRAALDSAADVTGPGGTEVLITVSYADNRLVKVDSLDASDLVVTRLWDNHEMTNVTVVSKPAVDTASATVVYRVPAPSGTWGTIDDGDYRISLRAEQVWDTSYNKAAASELGSFNVDTTPGLIRVNATYDAPDTNPGDGYAADSTGRTTLRAAIMEANALAGENTIRVPPGTYALSIAGANEDAGATGDLDITNTLTIRGAGADTTIIDAAQWDRVFHVLANVTATINGVTITGGSADRGGGVLNAGSFTISNASCSGNAASGTGGGILNAAGATLKLRLSTLSSNSAVQRGGVTPVRAIFEDFAGFQECAQTGLFGERDWCW